MASRFHERFVVNTLVTLIKRHYLSPTPVVLGFFLNGLECLIWMSVLIFSKTAIVRLTSFVLSHIWRFVRFFFFLIKYLKRYIVWKLCVTVMSYLAGFLPYYSRMQFLTWPPTYLLWFHTTGNLPSFILCSHYIGNHLHRYRLFRLFSKVYSNAIQQRDLLLLDFYLRSVWKVF